MRLSMISKIICNGHSVSLPFHHRDPFDRMLIAQSLTDGMPILSADAVFDAYGISRLWD